MNKTMSRVGMLAVVAVMATAPRPASAAEADVAAIREEIAAMRADYEARIAALEARVAAAEAAASTQQASIADLSADSAAPLALTLDDGPAPAMAGPATAAGNALNPGISVVLNGNYFAASRDLSASRMPGFALGDEAGPPSRGFSLAESEVTLAANVDPYLNANLTVAFDGQGEAGVEEAYVQTTALPGGLTLKGGRFFSGIGYLNERHAHNWSFIDMPLPYRALLGNQYGDDGVQVRWLAPTDVFLEFGGEWLRGDSFPAANGANAGTGTQTLFVHTGGDVNASSSWLAAGSWIHAKADGRETLDPVFGPDIFSGDTDLGIVSAVYKWAPGGNGVQRNLMLSGEYFFGTEHGRFNGAPVDVDRAGWYAQGVYQFMPRWSVGLRYAELKAGDPGAAFAGTTLDDFGNRSWSATALLEYDSSEFGRFRAQYSRDESDVRASDQLMLQYTVVYGPHGAHRY
ncbi:MAG: hypothetical protein Q8L66_04740 [Caulobacter sp.]|nr:hypothetical protein [Caulobacter sp.]